MFGQILLHLCLDHTVYIGDDNINSVEVVLKHVFGIVFKDHCEVVGFSLAREIFKFRGRQVEFLLIDAVRRI